MNLTWKQTSKGKILTPYRSTQTNYEIFSTKILDQKVPIYVIQSSDTRDLIIAKKKNGKLIPARLHLGMERTVDLCSATFTIASTEEFKKAINHEYIPEKEAVSTMLVREPVSQSPFLNTFLGSGFQSRLYAIMDIHHVKDKKGLKGLGAEISSYRIDIPKEKEKEIHNDIKIAILYDSIAGGRNLKIAFTELKKRFSNLEKAVFVSIYATYEGCARIAKSCLKDNVACEFFCMHELLKANPKNQYDCFYPEWNICKKDEKLLKSFYKEKYRNICMGGDFSANTLGVEQAKSVFLEQIKNIDLNPKDFGC